MRQVIGKGMLATAAASSILSLSGSNAFAAGGDAVAANSPGILSGNSVQAPVEVPVNACGNSANVVGVGNPAMGNNCANAGASHKEHRGAPERTVTQERGGSARTDEGRGYGSDDDHTPDRDSHSGTHGSHPGSHPGTHAGTQSVAQGEATNSPGVLSGNNAQAPADVPVNACGNTVDIVGLLNPTGGNSCSNGAPAPKPPRHETPPSTELPPEAETTPRTVEPPTDRAMPPVKAGPPQYVASSTSASRQAPSVAHEAQHAAARLAATGGDQDLLTAAAASAALLVGGGILYRRGRASSGR
ncbi:chaplin [Streptomyces sp. NPDC051218]|uniref:chaplin n=1 Tax=Streptomyces sp. NPDC051218 TaxID=3365645 RepID=UPI0037988186